MNHTYSILSHDLVFSDEKLEFVRLKWQYQRKAWQAEDAMKEILPETQSFGVLSQAAAIGGAPFSEFTKIGGAVTSFLSEGDYEYFSIFQEARKQFTDKYLEVLKKEADEIISELEQHGISESADAIIEQALKNSGLKKALYATAEDYDSLVTGEWFIGGPFSGENAKRTYKIITSYYTQKANLEFDRNNSAFFSYVVQPLNHCFLALLKSKIGQYQLDPHDNVPEKDNIIHTGQKCSKFLFKIESVQNALVNNLRKDVFGMFLIKKKLMEEHGVQQYEVITSDDVEHADQLYSLFSELGALPEEQEKEMMAEALQSDPFQSKYYTIILERYFDPNGDLQSLAKETTVDVTTHIEKYLKSIYDDGDLSTLESTLEVKEKILEAEMKFCYQDSKAYKGILYRQHFLELSRQANEMNRDTIVAVWQSIKDGNNTFAGDERSDVGDDDCILILKRRFLRLCAAEYHDVIRNLGLTDDQTEGEKNYAFYEEGEDYLAFEEECFKIINKTLERDENFAVQNYGEDKLASGEVILGYFHYTRAMDIISDGKCLLITNQRIYTTKENFTVFDQILTCKPTKKLLVTSLVFDKPDGKTIELPVSKEIAVSAADMINRLIAALKNEEYTANSVEMSDSKAIAATKSTILGAASSAKKGLTSLFGKKKQGASDNTWLCTCGNENTGAFCPKCGTKRPES